MKLMIFETQFEEKLRNRGITRQLVRYAIARGVESPHVTFSGERRHKKSVAIGRHTLVVVYFENAHRILPISTYWLGEPDETHPVRAGL